LAYTAFGAVALRGDYAAGYRAARRILALAQARGYEPGASQARMIFAGLSFWAEPIENSVHQGQRAREGLIAGGDLTNAGYSNYVSVSGLLDCAPLERYLSEVEAALAFSRRTGKTGRVLDSYRWLAGVLRGESTAAAGEAVSPDKYAGDPVAQFFAHLSHGTAAAIFGDPAGLERHTAAAMLLVPVLPGLYPAGVARLLRGLALAGQARDADADTRGGLLSELDEVTRWLAERAADAPGNFLHLLRLVEAERAWAAGDFRAAALAFDAARHEAVQRQRPWHRALIAEHAARFYLARGLEHAGHDLLAQARQEYLAWGATAKVAQLDWAYPARRTPSDPAATAGEQPGDPPQRRAAVTAGTVDLLGILSASQALSSETSIDNLHARVAGVLSAMTGATGVRLLLWDADRQKWLLPAPGGGTVPTGNTGEEGAAPMSVLRYVQRTSEPLVVGDATGDDRFARDPYFADVDSCSLLAVPIFSRGALRAVLLLENRLIRAAFTTGRLDAVNLIAGQLAVSLDNAQLYAGYRRIAGEQAALRRVATLVAQAAPPPEVFAAVAEEAGRLLAVDFAVLVRYDPSDTLEVVGTWTSTGAPAATPVGGRLPLGGRNVTTLVWQTARPARIDYDDTISGVIGQAATRDWGVRSSVGVPVSVEGRLWGAIVVAFSREGLLPLPTDTEAQLAGFTELVATAIANTESRASVARLAEEQAALRRVATLVAAGAPPEEAFAAVAEEAGRLFLVDAANMCRYEPDGTATIVASAGGRFAVGSRLKLEGRNSTTLVYQTGRAARVESYADISGPIGVKAREGGVRSSVATPVMVEGRLWGALGVGAGTEQLLPPDAEARLASFAELVATAIANAESRTALTRLAEEQAALRRVATLVARGAAAEELFAAVTGEVGRLLGAHLAGMGRYGSDDTVRVVAAWGAEGAEHPMDPGPWPLDGGDLASIVFRTGQSVRIDDYHGIPGPIGKFVREELGVDASVASPILVEGRLWGVLFLHAKQARRPFPRDAESRLTGFTELVATAIANADSRAALAASRARIVTAADEARRRIERDLHDGTQQQLVSLLLDLRAVQAAAAPQLAELEGGLSGIADRIEGVFDQVREISHGIHPAILSERGLPAALRALARRSAVPVELDLRVERRLPDQVEVAAYYAVSEALANAAKHAQASAVQVELGTDDTMVRLAIRDDGIGGADPGQGSGLTGLRDRIEAVGGTLKVTSPTGGGTTLLIEIPV
jgi:GAF domain-containing protein